MSTESAVKHTPGPWKHLRGFPTSVWAGEGQSERWLASTNVETVPLDVREANAKLIAAAPELLEALEQCLLACRYPQRVPDMRSVVHAAEAAIKKAKGE